MTQTEAPPSGLWSRLKGIAKYGAPTLAILVAIGGVISALKTNSVVSKVPVDAKIAKGQWDTPSLATKGHVWESPALVHLESTGKSVVLSLVGGQIDVQDCSEAVVFFKLQRSLDLTDWIDVRDPIKVHAFAGHFVLPVSILQWVDEGVPSGDWKYRLIVAREIGDGGGFNGGGLSKLTMSGRLVAVEVQSGTAGGLVLEFGRAVVRAVAKVFT